MRSIRIQYILLLPVLLHPVFLVEGQQLIGNWKSHLSFAEAVQVADAGKGIYCATKSGLFFYDRNDHTVGIHTKVEGLSDQEVSSVVYAGDRGILIVGYRNANIDLIEGAEVYNMPDIKRKQLTGNKTINNLMVVGDFAYLSCGFGIVVLNLEKREILDTYYIGENGGQSNVYDMAFDGTWLYAATEQGVFRADINSPNLIDYNNWSRIQDLPYPGGIYNAITWFGGSLYTSLGNESGDADSLYYYESGSWHSFQGPETGHISQLGKSNDKLVVVKGNHVSLYDAGRNKVRDLILSGPGYAIEDQDNILWVADRFSGMVRAEGENVTTILPNGPLSNEVMSVSIMDNIVYTVAGGVTSAWNNTFNHAELNVMDQGEWHGSSSVEYRDLIQVTTDPADKYHVFVASWGYGLLEYRNGELIQVFRADNSTLQSIDVESDTNEIYYRLGGTVFDRDRNLWVTNTGVAEPVSVRKTNGQWASYDMDGQLDVSTLGRIINTRNDHKWILCPRNQGLFAFTVNGTLDDISDDRYRKFDVVDADGVTIDNQVYSFAEDKDGVIWVGTETGIVVYYNPSMVFEEERFYGQRIIVPRNDGSGLADILLQNERVTAIAIDGANRKWIGTAKAGVFLLSEDGLEEIHHFTAENSPLLSNNIMDIAINGDNGNVYIATDAGLISYKSTAIEGRESFDDVYVYPNPVRENHTGDIVITGLVGNVNVKITDIGGNLVYETNSLGGQAIWDGRTFSGDRVQTGVYMIFCTNEDGSQTHIAKLLVIH